MLVGKLLEPRCETALNLQKVAPSGGQSGLNPEPLEMMRVRLLYLLPNIRKINRIGSGAVC